MRHFAISGFKLGVRGRPVGVTHRIPTLVAGDEQRGGGNCKSLQSIILDTINGKDCCRCFCCDSGLHELGGLPVVFDDKEEGVAFLL
jgi:hypothetical protein